MVLLQASILKCILIGKSYILIRANLVIEEW